MLEQAGGYENLALQALKRTKSTAPNSDYNTISSNNENLSLQYQGIIKQINDGRLTQ